MTYPEFEKYMNALLNHEEREDKFGELLGMFSDGLCIPMLAPDLAACYISILEEHFNDANETISWWLYDAVPRDTACIWDVDGTEIPMGSIVELYDCQSALKIDPPQRSVFVCSACLNPPEFIPGFDAVKAMTNFKCDDNVIEKGESQLYACWKSAM